MELRCPNNKFGEVVQPGTGGIVEFKCSANWCGANRGQNVVIHRFEVDTQKLIDTRVYQNPSPKLNRHFNSTKEK